MMKNFGGSHAGMAPSQGADAQINPVSLEPLLTSRCGSYRTYDQAMVENHEKYCPWCKEKMEK
jgi:hypothetical protein